MMTNSYWPVGDCGAQLEFADWQHGFLGHASTADCKVSEPIGGDGKWHILDVYCRHDPDGTRLTIAPCADEQGKFTLALEHPIGLFARSGGHVSVESAKRHADEFLASMVGDGNGRGRGRRKGDGQLI